MSQEKKKWIDICQLDEILPNTGVAALVGQDQVAVFRIGDSTEVRAISNYDPFTKANVLSRGIIGSSGDVIKVASPLLKHQFNLETGEYIDDPTVAIPVYATRVVNGEVQVLPAC